MQRRCKCESSEHWFTPCRHVPNQEFCSAAECQRERKRLWQRKKMAEDSDYRRDQAAAQKIWNKANPDYWRNYRADHLEYAERNRQLQKERNQRLRHSSQQPPPPYPDMSMIAKMDAFDPIDSSVPAGYYRLVPHGPEGVAKMDAYILVQIDVIAKTYSPSATSIPCRPP
jgi:hypothetical protein